MHLSLISLRCSPGLCRPDSKRPVPQHCAYDAGQGTGLMVSRTNYKPAGTGGAPGCLESRTPPPSRPPGPADPTAASQDSPVESRWSAAPHTRVAGTSRPFRMPFARSTPAAALTSAYACSPVSALDGLPSRSAGVFTCAATLRATMSSASACRMARTRQLRAICSVGGDSSPLSRPAPTGPQPR